MHSLRSQTVMMFAVGVLTLGAAAVGWAADFNITVPVRISNLDPGVAKVRVICSVKPATGVTTIGSAYVDNSPDAGGNFNKNVLVSFNAYSGMDPAIATRYSCYLALVGINGTPMCDIGNSPQPVKACQGTGIVPGVMGIIPKQ
jgi:hypothetical protein